MKGLLVYLIIAAVGSVSIVSCQNLPIAHNVTATKTCPTTRDQRDSIIQDIKVLLNNSVLPSLNHTTVGLGDETCGCGGPRWRRAAYLNMSDPTQTCPPAWELIATPRRSCARPSNAGSRSCYSAMFPTQGIQYSQVCGRIIGYQVGQPQAFVLENSNQPQTIDGTYVDGVSLTYGRPRQHIWTFASSLDEASFSNDESRCTCTDSSRPNDTPSFVGNDYFCETGVPPGLKWSHRTFHADDPLWDGGGCGPTSTCCTFNNPPWFCKQLSRSANADLEVRLCSAHSASAENTPLELIEVYVK